jgi:DNA-binding Lrp family transcriptional regulator
MSGETDYLCRILVSSIAEYEQFLKQVLLHLPGASAVNSSFALRRVKQTHKIPI